MIRYCKQKDKVSCGPVALLNALKWADQEHSWTYKDIRELQKDCQLNGGTLWSDLLFGIIKQNVFEVEAKFHPTMQDIEQSLDYGETIILLVRWKNHSNGHYFNIIDKSDSGKTFYIVNAFVEGKAQQHIRRSTLKRWLAENRKYSNKPLAIFLGKRE